ncbi:MAG: PfkB family carbohydrate kinase [Gemmatimonadota bacterium]|nr:PfkB family carbohydrate kinase [Gemmatimonadota bacterium]
MVPSSPSTPPPLLGVTGTAVEDTIVAPDGSVVEDMGGIYYAVLTLRALLPDKVRIAPVLAVGADAYGRVRRDMEGLPGVEAGALLPVEAVNNKVRLEYRDAEEREETLRGGIGPLAWGDLEPWVDRLDAWLWNFVAGNETDRETFGRVKRAFGGPIHLDVHSLCLEHDSDGPRRPRRPERWEAWVEGVRWVQCNESEAGLLWRGRDDPLPADEERRFAGRCHELGAEGVLVSRGSAGACWHPADGEPLEQDAVGTGEAVDPTGCGDVLGAAWIALRAGRGLEAGEALAGAVRAAGAAAGIRGTSSLRQALERAAVLTGEPA